MAAHEGSISACHSLREASWGVACPLHKLYMPEVGLSGVALWANVAFLPRMLPQTHFNQPAQLAPFLHSGERHVKVAVPCGYPKGLYRGYCLYTAVGATLDFAMAALKEVVPSNQWLPHWIVDTISHAYGASGRPLPSGLRYHCKEHLNILGCPERGAPGDHLRRGVVGVFWHILQLSG